MTMTPENQHAALISDDEFAILVTLDGAGKQTKQATLAAVLARAVSRSPDAAHRAALGQAVAAMEDALNFIEDDHHRHSSPVPPPQPTTRDYEVDDACAPLRSTLTACRAVTKEGL